jgi:uncharacterized protein YjbJ (UPF0337 family)
LRPAIGNPIIRYWSIYGSASGKKTFPKRVFTCSQTVKVRRTVHGLQRIENNHRLQERITMKPSTQDKTQGKLHEVKGAIKQTAGKIADDPNLETEGSVEKNTGKVQNAVGKVEKAIGA